MGGEGLAVVEGGKEGRRERGGGKEGREGKGGEESTAALVAEVGVG